MAVPRSFTPDLDTLTDRGIDAKAPTRQSRRKPCARFGLSKPRFVFFFLLALGPAAAGCPAAAERIRAELGFAGYVVPGRWVPLRLDVGGGAWTVEIAGGAVEEYRARPGERLECAVRFAEDGGAAEMRLIADGRVVSRQSLHPGRSAFPGHLVLASGVPGGVQRAVEAALQPAEPVRVAPVEPDRFPGVALNYDAVSAIILEDPGPILNPAQVRAIRAWLTGGGRMVLLAPRPGEDGLLSLLLPGEKAVRFASTTALPVGLGRLVLLRETTNDPESWREILALTPYAQSFRLSASRAFDQDEPFAAPAAADPPKEPAAVLAVWASLAGILGAAARRRPLLAFLIFTAAAGAAAVPVGRWLDRRWQRGVGVHARAVILPDDGGTLVEFRLIPGAAGPFQQGGPRPPDWGANLGLGQAGTGVYGGAERTLRWRQGRPAALAASADARLTGYLPAAPCRVG